MKISTATVAVWLAFANADAPVSPSPQPVKCCGQCNGTGMVWSGDGLQRLQCPCPSTCSCAKNRPKVTCVDGKCGRVQ